MEEMTKRGYHPDEVWNNHNYRGKKLGEQLGWADFSLLGELAEKYQNGEMFYPEHNDKYLKECLNNLKSKGIEIILA